MRKKKFLVFRLKLEAKQTPRRLTCGADEYKTIAPHVMDLNKQQLVREYTANVIGDGLFGKSFGTELCRRLQKEEAVYVRAARAAQRLFKQKDIVIKHYGNDYYVYINEILVDKMRVNRRKLDYSEVE